MAELQLTEIDELSCSNPNHIFISEQDIFSKEFLSHFVNKDMEQENLFSKFFSPFVKTVKINNDIICSTTLKKFNRIFGITSNILDFVKPILESSEIVLAGGKIIDYVNNISFEESNNDYDFFMYNTNENSLAYNCLSGSQIIEEVIQKTFDTVSLNLSYLIEFNDSKYNKKAQYIKKNYAEISEIIQNFDFRCCAICVWRDRIYWVKGALRDIFNKKLILMNAHNLSSLTVRLQKYLQRGYTISGTDLVLLSIKSLDNIFVSRGNTDRNKQILNRDFVYERNLQQIYEEFVNN